MIRLVVAVSAIAIPAVALVACAGSSPPAPTSAAPSSVPPATSPPPSTDNTKSPDAGVASPAPSAAASTVPPTATPAGWLSVSDNDKQTWTLKMCPEGGGSTAGGWADCYLWPGKSNRNVTTYFHPASAPVAIDGGAGKLCTIVASRQGDAGSPPFAPGEYVLYQPADADGGPRVSPAAFINQQIEKGHTVIFQSGFTGSIEVTDPTSTSHSKRGDSKDAGKKCAMDTVETWLLSDPGAGTYTRPAPGAGDVSLTFEWENPDAGSSNGAKYKCSAKP